MKPSIKSTDAKNSRRRKPSSRRASRPIIRKLDAAVRQLKTALDLWFHNGDVVSIHTLASASYEVVHSIVISRSPPGHAPELLYNSLVIKDEARPQWISVLRRPQNFFKHADKDPNGMIDFDSQQSELVILCAINGLWDLGLPATLTQSAFLRWLAFNRSGYLSKRKKKEFLDGVPADQLRTVRSLSRLDFLKFFRQAYPLFTQATR
jgi:hypothetical protein